MQKSFPESPKVLLEDIAQLLKQAQSLGRVGSIHDGERLARALRMDRELRSDTWPLWVGLPWGVALGPWFHVPLPVKCVTEFLDPIPTAEYGPDSAEDPEVLQALYDQVQGVMQDRLDALADEFPGMF